MFLTVKFAEPAEIVDTVVREYKSAVVIFSYWHVIGLLFKSDFCANII